MKLRLRHAKTGFYFAAASQWVTESVLAFDFQAVNSALDFVVRENASKREPIPARNKLLAALKLTTATPAEPEPVGASATFSPGGAGQRGSG